MDPPADQHQSGQLANRKRKKGRKDEEGEDNSQEKKETSVVKKFSLYLTSMQVSRELVLRVVIFSIVYLILTRLIKIFTN